MRKLAVNAFVSLDGVMQALGAPEEDPTVTINTYERGGDIDYGRSRSTSRPRRRSSGADASRTPSQEPGRGATVRDETQTSTFGSCVSGGPWVSRPATR
jgi:hypothetical protein